MAEEEANNAGVTAQDVALSMNSSFEGSIVGVYREGDELLPILFPVTFKNAAIEETHHLTEDQL